VLRRRRSEPAPEPGPVDPLAHVDPALVPRRFAGAVAGALDARRRYADVVAGTRPGPLRDRLAATGTRLDAGVEAVWDAARRAGEVMRTLDALDPDRVADDYKRAKRTDADPALVRALHERFTSVQRLLNLLDETDERLRLLDARLGAVVARAAETALGTLPASGASPGDDPVGTELDDVVAELTALRDTLTTLP
jgi:hypothetical protein